MKNRPHYDVQTFTLPGGITLDRVTLTDDEDTTTRWALDVPDEPLTFDQLAGLAREVATIVDEQA